MTDKRYTEDEIRAAVIEGQRKWRRMTVEAAVSKLEDIVMAELTRPEIGPDVVVTYTSPYGGNGLANKFRDIPGRATNIVSHYPEDKVLAWGEEIFKRVWQGKIPWDNAVAELKARMDAFKRGSP